MKLKRKVAFAHLIVLAAPVWVHAACKTGDTLHLKGIIVQRHVRGALSFGETPSLDSKLTISILRLTTPIYLPSPWGKTEPPRSRYRQLQVFCSGANLSDCELIVKKAIGHTVQVSGHVSEAIEPGDFLPMIIEPCEISTQAK